MDFSLQGLICFSVLIFQIIYLRGVIITDNISVRMFNLLPT